MLTPLWGRMGWDGEFQMPPNCANVRYHVQRNLHTSALTFLFSYCRSCSSYSVLKSWLSALRLLYPTRCQAHLSLRTTQPYPCRLPLHSASSLQIKLVLLPLPLHIRKLNPHLFFHQFPHHLRSSPHLQLCSYHSAASRSASILDDNSQILERTFPPPMIRPATPLSDGDITSQLLI